MAAYTPQVGYSVYAFVTHNNGNNNNISCGKKYMYIFFPYRYTAFSCFTCAWFFTIAGALLFTLWLADTNIEKQNPIGNKLINTTTLSC